MKAKFEADCKTLWEKMKEVIPELNDKQGLLTIITTLFSVQRDNTDIYIHTEV